MRNLLFTVMACVAIGGCAQVTPYRTDLKPFEGQKPFDGQCIAKMGPAEKGPPECPDDAYFLVGEAERIPIGIVVKDKILNRIRDLTNKHGTLTVVFAHGWLNNASPKNKNLANFQEMLKEIAETDRTVCKDASCEGRKVVGVYLAWRGMSAKVQPFKGLSFWNRKSRAHRVGQDGATEVLADLAKVNSASKRSRDSRLIFIGHSFGGALIYSATQQLLMQDAAAAVHEKDEHKKWIKGGNGKWIYKSVPRTIADLVILVNPAFEAARFTALHDKAETMNFPETQSAILAIFTSETDKATKWAFPLGRRLSTLFTKYNTSQFPTNRSSIGPRSDTILGIRLTR